LLALRAACRGRRADSSLRAVCVRSITRESLGPYRNKVVIIPVAYFVTDLVSPPTPPHPLHTHTHTPLLYCSSAPPTRGRCVRAVPSPPAGCQPTHARTCALTHRHAPTCARTRTHTHAHMHLRTRTCTPQVLAYAVYQIRGAANAFTSEPPADEASQAPLGGLPLLILMVCVVVNLVALLLSWVYTFDLLGREIELLQVRAARCSPPLLHAGARTHTRACTQTILHARDTAMSCCRLTALVNYPPPVAHAQMPPPPCRLVPLPAAA
jgi:hypothetical protein